MINGSFEVTRFSAGVTLIEVATPYEAANRFEPLQVGQRPLMLSGSQKPKSGATIQVDERKHHENKCEDRSVAGNHNHVSTRRLFSQFAILLWVLFLKFTLLFSPRPRQKLSPHDHHSMIVVADPWFDGYRSN